MAPEPGSTAPFAEALSLIAGVDVAAGAGAALERFLFLEAMGTRSEMKDSKSFPEVLLGSLLCLAELAILADLRWPFSVDSRRKGF
jgi:hypothetical protein